ncbi:hypothetical protein [Vibrio parahaemolyticus]|uniref:hypothetical protein n=1 Tax=Vibrio parahaemolyticus TaxID=670 RepID=UPI00041A3EFD|nr:hypothetical protein [Vibrio parahaemolyticus]EJG1729523.1 hypothetical protein [Vibrio parahaemolyticus]OCP43718.1 hypothetical protein AKH06_16295 [Vibrio parahaemolyticus]OCP50903.1 hypothetical protein AKH02_00970 [Vibrio parahaemolyticus]HCG6073324.1 hypothetical protein [Vibrio parahaemolyticus]HCG6077043.1 hypothetical protein [Vibrio parahaemolyticus]
MNQQRLRFLKRIREYLPLLTAGSYILSILYGMLLAALRYYPLGIPFFDFASLQDLFYLGALNFWNGILSIVVIYIIYKLVATLKRNHSSFTKSLITIGSILTLLVWWGFRLSHPQRIDIEGGYSDVYRVQVKSESPINSGCFSLIGSTFDYLFIYNYLEKRTLVIARSNIEHVELLQKGIIPPQEGWSLKPKTIVRQEVRTEWEVELSKICGKTESEGDRVKI